MRIFRTLAMSLLVVFSAAIFVSPVSAAIFEGNAVFNDVTEDHWAANAISILAEKEIINGIGEGVFAPKANVTRAEFAKMLVLAKGLDVPEVSASTFADVPLNKWYAKYIEAAYQDGLIKGYDGRFNPNDQINRQEIIAMVVRAAGLENEAEQVTEEEFADVLSSFSDSNQFKPWARSYAAVAVKQGLVNGFTDNTVRPVATANRAEAAKLVAGILEYLPPELKDGKSAWQMLYEADKAMNEAGSFEMEMSINISLPVPSLEENLDEAALDEELTEDEILLEEDTDLSIPEEIPDEFLIDEEYVDEEAVEAPIDDKMLQAFMTIQEKMDEAREKGDNLQIGLNAILKGKKPETYGNFQVTVMGVPLEIPMEMYSDGTKNYIKDESGNWIVDEETPVEPIPSSPYQNAAEYKQNMQRLGVLTYFGADLVDGDKEYYVINSVFDRVKFKDFIEVAGANLNLAEEVPADELEDVIFDVKIRSLIDKNTKQPVKDEFVLKAVTETGTMTITGEAVVKSINGPVEMPVIQ